MTWTCHHSSTPSFPHVVDSNFNEISLDPKSCSLNQRDCLIPWFSWSRIPLGTHHELRDWSHQPLLARLEPDTKFGVIGHGNLWHQPQQHISLHIHTQKKNLLPTHPLSHATIQAPNPVDFPQVNCIFTIVNFIRNTNTETSSSLLSSHLHWHVLKRELPPCARHNRRKYSCGYLKCHVSAWDC